MLKWHKWLILVAALAIVVGVDWQSSIFACIGQQAIEQPREDHQTAERYEEGCPYNGLVFGPAVAFFESIDWTPEAVTAAATIVIAAFTIILGIATGLQYSAVMASVRISEKANQLNRDNFTATERPWIALTNVTIAGSLRFDDTGLRVSVKFTFKNTGRSPARNVQIEAKLFPERGLDPRREQERFCAEARGRAGQLGYVVFPDQTFSQTMAWQVTREEIDAACHFGGREFDWIILALAGCLQYRFMFDESPHQTGFILDIYRPTPNGALGGIFPANGDVDAADLRISHYSFGIGSYAN